MIGIATASGRALAVAQVQVVALYDPKTGAIRHVHLVTTLAGAQPLTESDVVAEARRRASRGHQNADRLSAALSNDAEHGHRPHRIDPKTRRFVPLVAEKAKRRTKAAKGGKRRR